MSEKDGIECPKCGSDNTEYMGEKGINGPVEWVCYSGGHVFRRKDLKETSQKTEIEEIIKSGLTYISEDKKSDEEEVE